MKIAINTQTLGRLQDDACVVFSQDGTDAKKVVRSLGVDAYAAYRTLLSRGSFAGKPGQVVALHQGEKSRVPSVIVVGVGSTPALESLRHAAGAGVRAARSAGAASVSLAMPAWEGRGNPKAGPLATFLCEGALVGLYRFTAWKSDKAPKDIGALSLVGTPAQGRRLAKSAAEGEALAMGVILARNLGNEPSNSATPTYLAAQALDLAEREETITTTIIEEDAMLEMGMGSLLGVGQGSAQPSKLIVMRYTPKTKKPVQTIAFVGKGITFDTGGISLKPGAKLEDMKFDMCGAAAVVGAMQSIARLRPNMGVVGVIPAVENMPDGNAYKPGDILTAMNGTTIEIRNTDAEGRLVLADALTWAATKLRPKPKAIVDLATLTGACVVSFGGHHAAIVSNTPKLVDKLMDAADASGDALWQMPLNDAYRKQLESPYADVSNLGSPGAGTITAGAFLEKFTEGVDWAHLDIAGTAWTSRGDGVFTHGATGFGVRALARLVQAW